MYKAVSRICLGLPKLSEEELVVNFKMDFSSLLSKNGSL